VAAIYVNQGASAAMLGVIGSGCVNVNAYRAQGAFGIILDEARSQQVRHD
jgi:hypothetical protein